MGWLESHCYTVTSVSASGAEYAAYASDLGCAQTLPYALAGLELDGTCADPSNRPAPCEAAGLPYGFLNLVMINLIPVTGYQATLDFDPSVVSGIMAVDGTNGRFSAHNQRFNELRRKKLKRREEKLLRNTLKNPDKDERINFKELDPDTTAKVKSEVRKKAQKLLRRDWYMLIVSIIIAVALCYYFFY